MNRITSTKSTAMIIVEAMIAAIILYGTVSLLGWKFAFGWDVCIFGMQEFVLRKRGDENKNLVSYYDHVRTVMSSIQSSIVPLAACEIFRLCGWKIFLGCAVLTIATITVAAQIQLQKANVLARKYMRLGCPQDATNVTVYFRFKFFKMACLGWCLGGRAEFFSMPNIAYMNELLKRRTDRYVYLNPGKINGPAYGKLLHVGELIDEKIGASLTLECYLGDDIGIAPTIACTGPVAVIVFFDSKLPAKEWVAASV